MRIVAGSAKGARLAPVPDGVRPLTDRAREGLFSSLGPERSRGAACSTCSPGTGAMGIEALSRGAERATFVERRPHAVAAIHRNLTRPHLRTDAGSTVGRARVRSCAGPTSRGPRSTWCSAIRRTTLGPPELDDVLQELARGWVADDGSDRGPDQGQNGVPCLSFRYTGPSRGSSATATASCT